MFEEKGVGGSAGNSNDRVLPDPIDWSDLLDPDSLDDPVVLAALAARWCDHDDPPDPVDVGGPPGWAGPAQPWPDGWLTPPPDLPPGVVATLAPDLDPTLVAASFRPHQAPPEAPELTLANWCPSGWLALDLDATTSRPATMSDALLIDALVGWEHLISWATARQVRVLAEFGRRRPDDPRAVMTSQVCVASDRAPDEVALALQLSRGAARNQLGRAAGYTDTLTDTLGLLEQGGLDRARAHAICDTVAFHTPETALAVQARVLPQAPGQTVAQLRAALWRAVIAVDPRGAAERHRAARKERRVTLSGRDDGMASLWALLAAPDAIASYEWLTRLARSLGKHDPRPMDARRANLLVDLLTGRLELHDNTDTDDTDTADTDDTAETDDDDTDDNETDTDSEGVDTEGADSGDADSEGADSADVDSDTEGVDTEESADSDRSRSTSGSASSTERAGTESAARNSTKESGTEQTGTAQTGTGQTGTASADDTEPDEPGVPLAGGPGQGRRKPKKKLRRGCGKRPARAGKPLVHVIVPYSTLTGADDQPCHLAGYGPIPADLAREIAAHAVWKRLITDPLSGVVLDHGRDTYRPPLALAEFIRARDLHCRMPGCQRQASNCELDHTIDYAKGGTTTDTNLYTGCLHDHRIKDRPGWSVRQTPHGRVEWTTPTGHRYASDPHDYRPDHDPDPPLLRHPPIPEPLPEQLPGQPTAEPDQRTNDQRTNDQRTNPDPNHDQDTATSTSTSTDTDTDTGAGEDTETRQRSRKRRWPIRHLDDATKFGLPGATPIPPTEDDLANPPPF